MFKNILSESRLILSNKLLQRKGIKRGLFSGEVLEKTSSLMGVFLYKYSTFS